MRRKKDGNNRILVRIAFELKRVLVPLTYRPKNCCQSFIHYELLITYA